MAEKITTILGGGGIWGIDFLSQMIVFTFLNFLKTS